MSAEDEKDAGAEAPKDAPAAESGKTAARKPAVRKPAVRRKARKPAAGEAADAAKDAAEEKDAEKAPAKRAPRKRAARKAKGAPAPEPVAAVDAGEGEAAKPAADAGEGEPAKPAAKPARRPAGRRPRRRTVRARARYVRTSARKARLVCGHLRGKSVQEARAILAFTPREVARDWSKLLESAVANAESNHELLEEDLIVREAYADEGPTIKRFRPRAMGRATPIHKRTSHLTITLTPRAEPGTDRRRS
jgi:ribosomal protein L22